MTAHTDHTRTDRAAVGASLHPHPRPVGNFTRIPHLSEFSNSFAADAVAFVDYSAHEVMRALTMLLVDWSTTQGGDCAAWHALVTVVRLESIAPPFCDDREVVKRVYAADGIFYSEALAKWPGGSYDPAVHGLDNELARAEVSRFLVESLRYLYPQY